jgi:hypothetical protein
MGQCQRGREGHEHTVVGATDSVVKMESALWRSLKGACELRGWAENTLSRFPREPVSR